MDKTTCWDDVYGILEYRTRVGWNGRRGHPLSLVTLVLLSPWQFDMTLGQSEGTVLAKTNYGSGAITIQQYWYECPYLWVVLMLFLSSPLLYDVQNNLQNITHYRFAFLLSAFNIRFKQAICLLLLLQMMIYASNDSLVSPQNQNSTISQPCNDCMKLLLGY